jgi:hypothetical protein
MLLILISLESCKEAQKDKKISNEGLKTAERTLELEAERIESIILLHLQIDAASEDGLQQRCRGRTTWSAAQRDPSDRASTATEWKPYCL